MHTHELPDPNKLSDDARHALREHRYICAKGHGDEVTWEWTREGKQAAQTFLAFCDALGVAVKKLTNGMKEVFVKETAKEPTSSLGLRLPAEAEETQEHKGHAKGRK